jgi:phospholipase C
MRLVSLVVLVVAALLLTPLLAQGTTPTLRTPAERGGARICAGRAAPVRYQHVIWILFENEGYDQIIGASSLPFTNRLAVECGLATNYYGVGDPSLPNYIAMTSGGTWGVSSDTSGPLDRPSIFSQLRAQGLDWRVYAESMPRNCYPSDFPSQNSVYTAHHEAVLYYSAIRSDCRRWDVPLGTATRGPLANALANNTLPAFAIISPNDDGGTTKPGCARPCGDVDPPLSDSFLRIWINRIVASNAYRSGATAIFITWDEDASFSGHLCPTLDCDHLATLVVAPSVPAGTRAATRFSHYSLLRTTEELLGLKGRLGHAASAASMSGPLQLLHRPK